MELSRTAKTEFKIPWSSGSDEDISHSCDLCNFEGNVVEAEGFCQNCQEYLCGSCIRYHKKATQSRRHKVLDKMEMPKDQNVQKNTDACTETCPKHASELLKFFCKQHDIVGCGDCIVLGHKACEIEFIPEISKTFDSEDESNFILGRIHALEKKVGAVNEVLEKNRDDALGAHRKNLRQLKSTRQMINDYLDKMEERMVSESTKLTQENEETVENLKETMKLLMLELSRIKSRIKLHAKKSCDLFVTIKQATDNLIKFEKEFDSVSKNAKMLLCQIEGIQTPADLSNWHPFGHLVKITKEIPTFPPVMIKHMKLEYEKEITNVSISSDDEVCEIPGMVSLSKNTLAVADTFNKCVKIWDTTRDKVTAQVNLTSEPFDITRISDSELAVTLPDEGKISFVSLQENLKEDRSIEVSGDCKGIEYSNDKLFVAYSKSAKIEILSLQGKLLSLIKSDGVGNDLFERPEYIAVGSSMDSLYVSDEKAVLKVTFDGKVLARYTDCISSWPEALEICKDGSLLVVVNMRVSDMVISSIHHITPDCKKIKVLVDNGLLSSSAMCLDSSNDKLFVKP